MILWLIAKIVDAIMGVLLSPFRSMHPFIGLLFVSAATGIVMVLIFGKTSNQNAIKAAKAKLKAYIAEIWLFRNDLLVMLAATVRVFAHTGRYLLHSLRPIVFLMVPVLAIMVTLGLRYGHRPLHPGETILLCARLDCSEADELTSVDLDVPEGLSIVAPPLRISRLCEGDWQVRAEAPGSYDITIKTPRGTVTKRILVSEASKEPLVPVSTERGRWMSAAFLEYPAEPPLDGKTAVSRITCRNWPERNLSVFGLGVHWLVAFFILSIAAGFAVKDLFGVEV